MKARTLVIARGEHTHARSVKLKRIVPGRRLSGIAGGEAGVQPVGPVSPGYRTRSAHTDVIGHPPAARRRDLDAGRTERAGRGPVEVQG